MKRLHVAALALSAALFVCWHAEAASINGMEQVYVCDASTNQGNNCLKPQSDGSINVNGTFSATLSGFTPGGTTANLSVSGTSADVALPAGTVVKVVNWGTADVHFRVAVGAGTAVTTDEVLKSGAATGITVGSNTHLSAITDTGTSSLSLSGGTGLVTGYGGGGSGSGGGDASAANQTVVQAVIGAATAPTKMNAAGGVYNSTPLTLTNGQSSALQLDANGYVNVDVKSATGVAQGSTTSGQTASPIGCRTLSATPTDTTAQTNIPVCNIRGNLVVSPYTLPDNLVNGTTAAMTGTTSTSLLAAPGAGLFNYITQISCVNSHATVGTFVTVQDGSGGTALMTLAAGSLFGGDNKTFPAPFKQTTSNTALFVADVTTGANVICSASGYKGP